RLEVGSESHPDGKLSWFLATIGLTARLCRGVEIWGQTHLPQRPDDDVRLDWRTGRRAGTVTTYRFFASDQYPVARFQGQALHGFEHERSDMRLAGFTDTAPRAR